MTKHPTVCTNQHRLMFFSPLGGPRITGTEGSARRSRPPRSNSVWFFNVAIINTKIHWRQKDRHHRSPSFFYFQGSRGDPGDPGLRGDSGSRGPKVAKEIKLNRHFQQKTLKLYGNYSNVCFFISTGRQGKTRFQLCWAKRIHCRFFRLPHELCAFKGFCLSLNYLCSRETEVNQVGEDRGGAEVNVVPKEILETKGNQENL